MGSQKVVAVVGAGLVGSLQACILAKRGFEVHLYELRDDIREMEHVPGRSINLALSYRGRRSLALASAELERQVISQHAIAMRARMIHNVDGSKHAIPYGVDPKEQCIYSVGRRFLNETLLNEASKYPNVHFHFQHKLVSIDLQSGKMIFDNGYTGNLTDEIDADVVFGADGAFSAVRQQMCKRSAFNYSQTYIPHGYMELCIPPTEDGQFAMEANYLHIWPRGQFMLIALPNQDCSYTVTLFLPFERFAQLSTPTILLKFFEKYFPDALNLIGEEKLQTDFFNNSPASLVSVKCKPYNVGGTAVLIGDAAHAMVPFFGQGMNAGFEDCFIMDCLLDKHVNDFEQAFSEFSEFRNPDAEAICDLAIYNYTEMRDLVNHLTYRTRKNLDYFLYRYVTKSWVPLYISVTFTHMRYHMCVLNRRWQDKVLRNTAITLAVVASAVSYRYRLPIIHGVLELFRNRIPALLSRKWH